MLTGTMIRLSADTGLSAHTHGNSMLSIHGGVSTDG
jgi:hypothetical protein